jgi:hypothetical protein
MFRNEAQSVRHKTVFGGLESSVKIFPETKLNPGC